jgi:hypothetical protein
MFIILSTIILFALSLLWRSTDPLNLFIKICLVGMSVWGIILIANGAF